MKLKIKLSQTTQQTLTNLNSTTGKGQTEQGLFLPTRNQRYLKVRGNLTPMWRYRFSRGALDGLEVQNHNHKHTSESGTGGLYQSVSNPFTTNNLKKTIVDDQQLLSGLVVLNGRDHNNGQASIFGFERGRKLGEVLKEINSHLHLGVDLSFHGLFLFHNKGEGRFLSNSSTMAEEGLGDVEVVELRHLPIYQFVDNSQQPPQLFNFYDDNITIAQLTKELAQGVQALSSVSSLTSLLPSLRSKFPNVTPPPLPFSSSSSSSSSNSSSSSSIPLSSLRIIHLPHGEGSVEQNWLQPTSSLKSCQISRGSVLLLCEYNGKKTPSPPPSPPSSPSPSPSTSSLPSRSSSFSSSLTSFSSTNSLPSTSSSSSSPPSSPCLPSSARTFFRSVCVAQSPFHVHSNWRNLAEYPLMEVFQLFFYLPTLSSFCVFCFFFNSFSLFFIFFIFFFFHKGEKTVASLHGVTQVLDTRQGDKKEKEKKEKEKKEKKKTRKKKELGDIHLTNANLIFCVFSPSFTYYTEYYVTPLQEIAKMEPSPSQSSKGFFSLKLSLSLSFSITKRPLSQITLSLPP